MIGNLAVAVALGPQTISQLQLRLAGGTSVQMQFLGILLAPYAPRKSSKHFVFPSLPQASTREGSVSRQYFSCCPVI